jgi:hypothetical protein
LATVQFLALAWFFLYISCGIYAAP